MSDLDSRVARFGQQVDNLDAWAAGDDGTSMDFGGGPVRSPARLIREKELEINESADGVLQLARTQALLAGEKSTAAGEAAEIALTTKAEVAGIRDAALVESGNYLSKEAGLSATTNGQFFRVRGSIGGEVAVFEFQNVAGVAVLQPSVPATSFVSRVASLAAKGGMVDTFVDVSRRSLDKIGSDSSISDPATYVSEAGGGMRVVAPPNSYYWMFGSDMINSGAANKFELQADCVSLGVSAAGPGFAFGAGAARRVYLYLHNGAIVRATNTGVQTSLVATDAGRAYAAGARVGVKLDVNKDGSGIFTVSKFDTSTGVLTSSFAVVLAVGEVPQGAVATAVRAGSTFVIRYQSTEGYNEITKAAIDTVSSTVASAKSTATNALLASGLNSAILEGLVASMERKLPGAWDGVTFDVRVFRRAPGQFFTDYEPVSRKPFDESAADNVFYVGYPGASDLIDGKSKEASFASWYKAINGRVGNTLVIVNDTGGDGAGRYNGTLGWRNATMLGNLIVRSGGTGKVITACQKVAPAWSLVAGTANTYEATVATVGSVMDSLHLDEWGEYTHLDLMEGTGSDASAIAASALAAVVARPGSYCISGGKVQVHAIDGRAPDADIRVYDDAINGYYTFSGGSLWLDKVVFEGGARPMYVYHTDDTKVVKVFASNCKFLCGGGTADGTAITTRGRIIAYLFRCRAAESLTDGLNWHAKDSNAGSVGPISIEIECESLGSGHQPSATSHNASTLHEGGTALTVMPKYLSAQNRVIHDIGSSRRIVYGGTVGNSRAPDASSVSIATSTNAKIWLDETTLVGSTYDFSAVGGGQIYVNDVRSGGRIVGGSAALIPYAP